MNSLSWLMYLANVCGNLGNVLTGLLVLTVLSIIGCLIYGGIMRDNSYYDQPEHAEGKAFQAKALKTGFPLIILWLMLSVVVPSQETIYAIAASETGETALKSDTGGKAVQALNAWLDRQIKGPVEPTR